MQLPNNKFTVVTVTFNAESSLEDTIQSVMNQNYPDLDFIIIDAASTDNTIEIIKKYGKYINYWISEPDSGIYEAMNKGIDAADGDWINFMNAGDTFSSDDVIAKISKQIQANSEIVYGDQYYLKQRKKVLKKGLPIESIFNGMPFGHQSAFFKCDVIRKFMFNDTYKFAADYDLLVQLYLYNHTFQYIELPVCNYAGGGLSESGVRPYLEALKILYDNCSDKKVIERNIYFRSFYKNSKKLLKKSIGK